MYRLFGRAFNSNFAGHFSRRNFHDRSALALFVCAGVMNFNMILVPSETEAYEQGR